MIPLEFFLPLAAAFIYAVGALLSKRAFQEGAGFTRMLVIGNWIQFFFFIPLLFFITETPNWSQLHTALLTGCFFFVGQTCTFLAIRYGDVSVQSPVMGTKMVFVAVFATLFAGKVIPSMWWWGAFLSMIGVVLLTTGNIGKNKGNILVGALFALASAAAFGYSDVLVAKHAKDFSIPLFPFIMMGVNAVLSLGFIPFFKASLSDISKPALKWVLWGGSALGFQATLLYFALSNYSNATAANILYSSRGIWSVVLVWMAGHWFANREKTDAGSMIMLRRFIGAALMLVAIALVLAS